MEKLGSGLNVVKRSSSKEVEEVKSSLPVGFRFNPTDKVIITRYLRKKAEGKALPESSPIPDADVYGVDHPCQLPASFGSYTENKDERAYFFTKRKRQQHSSREVTRNGCGMWKPTSSPDQEIVDAGTGMVIGLKGRLECSIPDSSSTKETHTKWIMKEYSLITKQEEVKEEENQEEWVLCKIKREKKEHPQFGEAAPSEEDNLVTVGRFPGEDGAPNEGKAGVLSEGIEKQEEFQAQQQENELKTTSNISTSLHKHVRASHVDVKMDEY